MQKILILGGNGFLGSEFKKVFLGKKISFLAPPSSELDALSPHLESYISEHQPDIILNCIAYTDVDGAESDKEKAYELNADLPERLAKISTEQNIRLIHFSTDYVFDGTASQPYDENSDTNPLSVYGASKQAGDDAIVKFGENYLIIRLSFPFGDHPKCFLQKILAKIEAGEDLQIVDEYVCSPTDMHALALRVSEMMDADLPAGFYHLTCAGECSRYEFTHEVLEILGNPVSCTRLPAGTFPVPAERPQYSPLTNTKLAPMPNWQTALRNYLTK